MPSTPSPVEQLAQLLDLVDVGLLEDRRVGHDVVAAGAWPCRIISIALSKTPSRSQTKSCVSRMPSRWTLIDEPLVRRDHAEDLLVEQQAVGAEVDVALARDDLRDQLRQLGVDRRLAAADRHDRRAALRRRPRRHWPTEQAVLELAGVALDRAAEAGEVAGVERLEHQHERDSACCPGWRCSPEC